MPISFAGYKPAVSIGGTYEPALSRREAFDIVAPFLLTPHCQKRKISAISLKSNPRKL
jgi:hypothetical protein